MRQPNNAYRLIAKIVEAYKATSAAGESPFLPHSLNFLDSNGDLPPYWIQYYRNLCPVII